MAFAVNYVARFTANPDQQHIDAVLQIYRYLAKTVDYRYTFLKNGAKQVECFSDADYTTCMTTRKSTGGYVLMLGGSPILHSS